MNQSIHPFIDLEDAVEGGLDDQTIDHPAVEPIALTPGTVIRVMGSLAQGLPEGASSKGIITSISRKFPFYVEATMLTRRAMTTNDVVKVSLGPMDPLQQHRDLGGFVCIQPYRPRDRREANLLFHISAPVKAAAEMKAAASTAIKVASDLDREYITSWAKTASPRATITPDKPGFVRLAWNAPKGIPSSVVMSVNAADDLRRGLWLSGPKGSRCRFAGPGAVEFDYNGIQFEIQADRNEAVAVMEQMQQPSPLVR